MQAGNFMWKENYLSVLGEAVLTPICQIELKYDSYIS